MSNWDMVQAMFIHVSCQVENDGRRNKKKKKDLYTECQA
jgi:hypothetical protein